MPLSELIEIVPLDKPVHAEITMPGSKSITNRALILAALAQGETVLRGALWSEDTQVMAEALRTLGFEVDVALDPEELCNRTITVQGLGGRIPRGGTAAQPLEIFVGNAGTAARFLTALLCLGHGTYRLQGVPRMHQRPQGALFEALRELGYGIKPLKGNQNLPVIIQGAGPRSGSCRVSIQESSQFASALLLCAEIGNWKVEISGENAEESPYVALTSRLIEAFPKTGGSFQVEPDASSGSYFLGVEWLLRQGEFNDAIQKSAERASVSAEAEICCDPIDLTSITIKHWPVSGWQIDADFLKLIFNQRPPAPENGDTTLIPWRVDLSLPDEISREHDLGDSIMTAAVLAPFTGRMICLKDLARLRVQESERVVGLRTELTRCGAKVIERGDTLTILPSEGRLHGAEIETYDDHRMAMCFAILGLKVPGIKLKNPGCVKKTFPNFFQKLATPPPHGLGVIIREGRTGRELRFEELFAD